MSRYRFLDTQPRVYVDRALVVQPGEVVDWPAGAPADGQWEPVGDDVPTAAELAAQDEQERVLAAGEINTEPPAPDAEHPEE